MPTCFVYGTLTDAERVAALLDGAWSFVGAARVDGLHVARGTYPTLLPAGTAEGRLLSVGAPDLATLDSYEGIDGGPYVRVALPLTDAGTVQRIRGGASGLTERAKRVSRPERKPTIPPRSTNCCRPFSPTLINYQEHT